MTVSRNIACFGAGYWGRNLIRNFSALGVLASVCEPNPERQDALRKEYPSIHITNDAQQVLNDPEVPGVVIATPAEKHGSLVRTALLAGKDVFVEKPLCLSLREGQELVALAHEKNRV